MNWILKASEYLFLVGVRSLGALFHLYVPKNKHVSIKLTDK